MTQPLYHLKGPMVFVAQALPTAAFFAMQALGWSRNDSAWLSAGLAIAVIAAFYARRIDQTPMWLGSNLHFAVSAPLIWGLAILGFAREAAIALDYVLVGVPLMITLVLAAQAWLRPSFVAWVHVAIGAMATGYAAYHPQDHQHAIALPLAFIFWGGVLLRLGAHAPNALPIMAVFLGSEQGAEG